MALTKSLLAAALANVPRHSFTRQAFLATAEARAQPEIVESVFGKGVELERALVREWEQQGLEAITPRTKESEPNREGVRGVSVTVPKGKSQREVDFEALRSALERRIRWSSNVGEHLVQAHALLATPERQLSTAFPRPVRALASVLGDKLRLDPAYVPPSERSTLLDHTNAGSSSQSTSTHNTPPQSLTIPLLNPLPLLSYALKIADEALYVSGAEPETKSGELDWYTRRLGIALIYLHAETHLLHPRPQTSPSASISSTSSSTASSTSPSPDPLLSNVLNQLSLSLARYRAISRFGGRVEELEREVAQFGWFVWKSWGGIFRSRGWIN